MSSIVAPALSTAFCCCLSVAVGLKPTTSSPGIASALGTSAWPGAVPKELSSASPQTLVRQASAMERRAGEPGGAGAIHPFQSGFGGAAPAFQGERR